MPPDISSMPYPDAPACPYDAMAVVEPKAAAFRDESVAARTESLLASLERKYGAWAPDATVAAAWRSGFSEAFRQAFASIPVVLAKPTADILYLVVSGRNVAALHVSGQVALSSSHDAVEIVRRLLHDPSSVFHWNRSALGVPIFDPHAAREFDGIADLLSSRARDDMTCVHKEDEKDLLLKRIARMRVKNKLNKDKASYDSLVKVAVEAAGGDFGALSKPAYAAAALLGRYQAMGCRAFDLATLRLFDPAILRLTDKTGDFHTYNWLAAFGVPDNRAVIAQRRQQFCALYPELVCHIIRATETPQNVFMAESTKREFIHLRAIGHAVDASKPLTDLTAAYRGWPRWVEKTLKGCLAANRVLGKRFFSDSKIMRIPIFSRHPEAVRASSMKAGDDIARLLACLGPAWRPRSGDASIVDFFAAMVGALSSRRVTHSSVAVLCPSPGGTPSPWKRAWRRIPEAVRVSASAPRNRSTVDLAIPVKDAIDAFERDVHLPVVNFFAAHQNLDVLTLSSAFANVSLSKLFETSQEWHDRLQAINLAKTGTPSKELRDQVSEWEPLFASFSMANTKIEVTCLTTTHALDMNGKELRHCVSSYSMRCLEGQCHIIGFSRDGRALATAEITGTHASGFACRQIKGPSNTAPDPDARGAFDFLLLELNQGRLLFEDGTLDLETSCLLEDGSTKGIFNPMGLCVTPDDVLAEGRDSRKKIIDRQRTLMRSGYDVHDAAAIDRVITAWRFALPDRVRAAWERAETPEGRVLAVGRAFVEMEKKC